MTEGYFRRPHHFHLKEQSFKLQEGTSGWEGGALTLRSGAGRHVVPADRLQRELVPKEHGRAHGEAPHGIDRDASEKHLWQEAALSQGTDLHLPQGCHRGQSQSRRCCPPTQPPVPGWTLQSPKDGEGGDPPRSAHTHPSHAPALSHVTSEGAFLRRPGTHALHTVRQQVSPANTTYTLLNCCALS